MTCSPGDRTAASLHHRGVQDVADLQQELSFPLMVKPLDTARFAAQFGRKLFIVESDIGEVQEKVALCRAAGHPVMLVGMVPGPDDVLSSYYTYRTGTGVASWKRPYQVHQADRELYWAQDKRR